MNSFGYPQRKDAQHTGRVGEIFVQYLITKEFEWIYRPVHREDDYGIDGYIDLVDGGHVTGTGLAIQVKCGETYFSEETALGFKYRGSKQHLNLYLNLAMPVILVIAHPDLQEAYWVEFNISKTVGTEEGWWIEIPAKNKLTCHSKSQWEEIAGPSIDYSDEIQNFWKVSEVMSDAGLFALAIPKSEVETLSYETVTMFFSRLAATSDMLLSKRNSVEIFFPDYDSDPRELYEIPEFRKWMEGSILAGVPWFYFLNTRTPSPSLTVLYACGCPVRIVSKGEKPHYVETEPKDRKKWLELNFLNLNAFTEANNISEDINREVSEAVLGRYFADWERAEKEIS